MPLPQTRLDRLLSGTPYSESVHVLIVGKESLGVKVLDEVGQPITDAAVTITDFAQPELTGVTFDEFDTLISDLQIYYSAYNDEKHKLNVRVKSPE